MNLAARHGTRSAPDGPIRLLDRLLPAWDARTRHVVRVSAPPAVVFAALRSADFGRSLPIRVLLGLRGMQRLATAHEVTLGRFLAGGFALVAETPGQEMVLGLIGKFWRLDGGLVETDALRFQEPIPAGHARVGWNFTVEPTAEGTRLTTETRIECADEEARRRFRAYWLAVRPLSGMVRRFMLREVRREALRTRVSAGAA